MVTGALFALLLRLVHSLASSMRLAFQRLLLSNPTGTVSTLSAYSPTAFRLRLATRLVRFTRLCRIRISSTLARSVLTLATRYGANRARCGRRSLRIRLRFITSSFSGQRNSHRVLSNRRVALARVSLSATIRRRGSQIWNAVSLRCHCPRRIAFARLRSSGLLYNRSGSLKPFHASQSTGGFALLSYSVLVMHGHSSACA